ncbi:MAG: hypothetical protein KatS3mg089_0259 [Patescibacteria group bacterium]|nr:MAG: hypothetical protein KatS3mg089_0259 [Patescibacteria group bacterium]
MNKKQFLINILIIFILTGLVIFLTTYTPVIHDKLQMPYKLVAGAQSVSLEEEKIKMQEKIMQDINQHLTSLGDYTMNLTLKEIISIISKTGKIADDLQRLQRLVEEGLSNEKN